MKKNFKIIIAIIITAIICTSGTVYAVSYMAKDIKYKDKTVEDALNELYSNSNNSISNEDLAKILNEKEFKGISSANSTMTVTKGKYYIISYARINSNSETTITSGAEVLKQSDSFTGGNNSLRIYLVKATDSKITFSVNTGNIVTYIEL